MKLSHYTIRNLIIPLLLVMAVWSCIFYFLILHEINDETNDSLQNYKEIIIKQFLADSTLLRSRPDIMTRYSIREVQPDEANLSKDEFFDSTTYIEIERESEPIRVLRTHFMSSNGKFYELRIETSTLEKEDLVETVLWSIIILYLILLLCILMVTNYAFKKSFRPLYVILKWLKVFHPGKTNKPLENDTKIEEFQILNKALNEASARYTLIYNEQKQFVENASHELQTPLAVCMNKLELLSENPNCTEDQLEEIGSILNTLHGIIKMNRSLLLLSRIDNNQFPDKELVRLDDIIQQVSDDLSSIYEEKHIKISIRVKEPLIFDINESLATTLMMNLIKNAYIHNIPNGEIGIIVSEKSITIENTGSVRELDKDKLFRRFIKQTHKSDSTGLGLAIVKSITQLYRIGISYRYNNGKHSFILTFP